MRPSKSKIRITISATEEYSNQWSASTCECDSFDLSGFSSLQCRNYVLHFDTEACYNPLAYIINQNCISNGCIVKSKNTKLNRGNLC